MEAQLDLELSAAADAAGRMREGAHDGAHSDGFAHPVEREFARIFDEHGIAWQYEPQTFVLEQSSDGTVREAFTPDFYLPDLGLYVECTVMRPELMHRKRRKARKARQQGITVEVLGRHDIERLARRWELDRLANATRTPGAACPPASVHQTEEAR